MASFRSLAGNGGSFGGSFGGDCLSLTVPLNPHVGGPSPGGGGQGGAGQGPAEVRLAGVDTKEKMYEPKQRKKLVRVLTVVAYLFFVSLAAAMLSLYYVFLWNPSHSRGLPLHAKTALRHLTEEQLRQQEMSALRELQRIQEQRRVHKKMRLEEQDRLQRQQQQVEQQRLYQQAWSTTLSPDYADSTDEAYTEALPPVRALRHHGGQGAAAAASVGEATGDTDLEAEADGDTDLEGQADNAIPQASRPRPPPSAPSLGLRQAQAATGGSGSAASASASASAPIMQLVSGYGGHSALRHSGSRNLRGLRLD